ncbi:MAG TPA: hypothetical protein VF550_01420, partial [Polyangia bacterium]
KQPTRKPCESRWQMNHRRMNHRQMNHPQWVVVVALASFGCRKSAQVLSEKTVAGTASLTTARSGFDKILPDVAPPFAAAAPIDFSQGHVRRAYISGPKRVEIAIARFGMDAGAFERWVAGSASYPQAQLALPAAQANGFFSCSSDLADSPCDLHIQLRSGFHVEIMGNGHTPRHDLVEFMSHIQLDALPNSTRAEL